MSQRLIALQQLAGNRAVAATLAPTLRAPDPNPVQRYASCTKARLSTKDCPDREPGELRRAATSPMVFAEVSDELDSGEAGVLLINFDVGKSVIKPNLRRDAGWQQFVKKVATDRSKWKIVGFSDCAGKQGDNEKLRRARAQAVLAALPAAIRPRITSAEGAPITRCIRENDNSAERTMNRSVALILVESTYDFPEEHLTDTFERKEPVNKGCSTQQKQDLALAFPLAPKLVEMAMSAIGSMEKGSSEEALLKKFFGPDAFKYRWRIKQGYNATLKALRASTYKCVAQGTDPCTGSTVGYTGVGAWVWGGPIIICGGAFSGTNTDRLELADTLIHEASHVGDSTTDPQYCSKTSGCSLSTTDQVLPGIGVTDRGALGNADSYSRFASAQL